MLVFDTETTGLVKPEANRLMDQPQIIEFAGIKLDDETLEEVGRLEMLINPGKPLPPEIPRITGITDEMLADKKPFAEHYEEIASFFLGEKFMVAHNIDFDRSLLKFDLMRIGKVLFFPWPMVHLCTVQAAFPIKNRRQKLTELHAFLTEQPHTEAHRAMPDVEALVRVVRELRKREMI